MEVQTSVLRLNQALPLYKKVLVHWAFVTLPRHNRTLEQTDFLHRTICLVVCAIFIWCILWKLKYKFHIVISYVSTIPDSIIINFFVYCFYPLMLRDCCNSIEVAK